ncbi:hypothetical protein Hanom_Chr17g01582001 [Helianthus anomalus]
MGFDNPIPMYSDMTGYDTSYTATPVDYNYSAPSYDPYLQVVVHNALCPSSFSPTCLNTRYPNYGYQYPIVPQQQPPPHQAHIEAINQALERAEQIQRQVERNERRTSKIFKKLSKIIKGRKDD